MIETKEFYIGAIKRKGEKITIGDLLVCDDLSLLVGWDAKLIKLMAESAIKKHGIKKRLEGIVIFKMVEEYEER